MTADPRARWAEELSVPADAPPGAAVEAFLRTLPGEDFLPPPERVAAVNALAGASAPVGRNYSVEQLLRDEVDAFAGRYWDLPPAERLAAWADLSRRGADPARLRELEPGLDVGTDALMDPDADELAGLFRSLFVLPPRERSVRRSAWLAGHAMDAFRWRAALTALLSEAPAVPALDPQFRAALGPHFDLAAFVAGAEFSPAEHRRTAVAEGVADFGGRMREYEEEAEPDYEAADRRRAKNVFKWSAGIACGVLLLSCLLNGMTRPDRGGGLRPPERGPAFAVQREFTSAEVARFEQYERDHTQTSAPTGFGEWIRAGRPKGGAASRVRFTYSFDRAQIRECQAYDRSRSGAKPPSYEFWVMAGKPSEPGAYPLGKQTP